MKELISFVIPCYRSEKTINMVMDEIIQTVSEKKEYCFEIIAINDSSPDKVLDTLKRRAKENDYLRVIDFAQNMGKHAALMAGYRNCKGNIIVCVDDDYQCPVNRLWSLLGPLNKEFDVSIAQYGIKKQSLFRNMGSFVNGIMAEVLIDKPKELQLSNFFAIKRFVRDEIIKYNNPYPYIDGLILRTTKNIANVPMKNRERAAGNSSYTLKKLMSLILNGFTAFSVKPLRIASVMGGVVALSGFVYGIYLIINKLIHPSIVAGYSSIMATLLLIGGMLMLMLGLIGEYIGRIYISINSAPQYVIRETINIQNDNEVN